MVQAALTDMVFAKNFRLVHLMLDDEVKPDSKARMPDGEVDAQTKAATKTTGGVCVKLDSEDYLQRRVSLLKEVREQTKANTKTTCGDGVKLDSEDYLQRRVSLLKEVGEQTTADTTKTMCNVDGVKLDSEACVTQDSLLKGDGEQTTADSEDYLQLKGEDEQTTADTKATMCGLLWPPKLPAALTLATWCLADSRQTMSVLVDGRGQEQPARDTLATYNDR